MIQKTMASKWSLQGSVIEKCNFCFRMISRKQIFCYLKIAKPCRWKIEENYPSYKLICHFIRGYLDPVSPYLYPQTCLYELFIWISSLKVEILLWNLKLKIHLKYQCLRYFAIHRILWKLLSSMNNIMNVSIKVA